MITGTSGTDTLITPSPRRRWRLALIAFAALAALAAVLWWLLPQLGSGASVSRSRLTLSTAAVGPMTRDVAAEGRVVAANAPTLYAPGAGTVSLAVQAGDVVKAGQVLATLASPEAQAQLAQQRSQADSLHSEWLRAQAGARAARAQAQSGVQTAELTLAAAQTELARQSRAFEAGATTGQQVDQAKDAVARARIALDQAQQLLGNQDDTQRFEVQAKRQAAERQQMQVAEAERQVAALSVRAPVDGQVGQLFVAERSSVAKDAKLLTVIDLSRLEVEVKVAESLAKELAIGMEGEISGNGQRWRGRLAAISPEVVQGEVAARLRFEGDEPAQLRQNQRLSVRVLLDHRERVLSVARGSFVEEGGGHFAYVLEGSAGEEAVKRPVRLGAQSLTQVEVLEGVKAGEQVVTGGADAFKGAARVRLIP